MSKVKGLVGKTQLRYDLRSIDDLRGMRAVAKSQ
jgi:hypothetical protein